MGPPPTSYDRWGRKPPPPTGPMSGYGAPPPPPPMRGDYFRYEVNVDFRFMFFMIGILFRHDPMTAIAMDERHQASLSNLPIPVGMFMNMAHVPPRFYNQAGQKAGPPKTGYNRGHRLEIEL